MRVGVAQICCVPGDVRTNCEKILSYAREAKARGCAAVVLPELVDTGYDMSKIGEIACAWDFEREESPASITMAAARESRLYVLCGLSEKVEEGIFNSFAVFNPQGVLIGKYRKTHLAAYPLFKEDSYIVPGNSLETAQVADMKWGLAICYDIRFPEVSRSLALAGIEVLAHCSAFPFPRLSHWRTLVRARAIENQVYVLSANRVGTDAEVTFCGSSAIIDPYGVTVAEAAEDREELIVGEIRRDLVSAVRNYMPVLSQRREDLYSSPRPGDRHGGWTKGTRST